MRETTYRVKGTTGDKLWVYLNLPRFFDGGSIWYEGVDWGTLGQSTGLLDKNGVEIFEGDMLQYYGDFDRKTLKRVVTWQERPFRCGWNIGAGRDGMHWVVVGNIYENL